MKRHFSFKINILVLLSIIYLSFLACDKSSSCGDILPYTKIIETTALNYVRLDTTTIFPLNIVPKDSAVAYQNYMLGNVYAVDYLVEKSPDFSGGGSLYALDCRQNGDAGTKVGLAAIDIITLKDYNAEYQANDTINDILSIINVNYNGTQTFSSIAALEAVSQEHFNSTGFFAVLKAAPNGLKDASFRIVITMIDGTKFTSDTENIKLK